MTSEEQIRAILDHTRETWMLKRQNLRTDDGRIEPHGIRIINFNKLSNEEENL